MPASKLPIQKTKLGNKATILIEENHSTPIVSFCAYFKGGSRHETAEKNGVSCLTQKVLIKGTEKFSGEELAFRTEAIGSQILPFAEKDSFGGHTSVLSKHLDEALELFFETFFHPTFPEDEVEKEKQLVLAEIEESRDEIYSHTLELCDKTLFARHPYRLPVRGTPESVRNLTRDDLLGWHQSWYHPNNMIFCIVGDVAAERAAEKVANYLAGLPKKKLPALTFPEEPPSGKRETVEERDKRQLAISLGFLAPPATDERRFIFDVLNGVLSGMGSRLFIELRDKKGLAYTVASRYEAFLDYGILKAFMGTAMEKEKEAKQGLIEELLRLRNEEIGEDELARTKRHLIGLYEIGRQRNATQALRFSRYEMLGLGWRMASQYPKKIDAIQASQVKALAAEYLDPENFSCAVVRPVNQPAVSNS